MGYSPRGHKESDKRERNKNETNAGNHIRVKGSQEKFKNLLNSHV